jgi:hypothetical protein
MKRSIPIMQIGTLHRLHWFLLCVALVFLIGGTGMITATVLLFHFNSQWFLVAATSSSIRISSGLVLMSIGVGYGIVRLL